MNFLFETPSGNGKVANGRISPRLQGNAGKSGELITIANCYLELEHWRDFSRVR